MRNQTRSRRGVIPARLGLLGCLAVAALTGCGKPAPTLQGTWSSGLGGTELAFKAGAYSRKSGGVLPSEVSGTWSLEGSTLRLTPETAKVDPILIGEEGARRTEEELRTTPVAWRVKWFDAEAFEATARSGASVVFRRLPE